jgi:hypothetical protein
MASNDLKQINSNFIALSCCLATTLILITLIFCPVRFEFVFVSVIESFDDTKGVIKSLILKDSQYTDKE